MKHTYRDKRKNGNSLLLKKTKKTIAKQTKTQQTY